MPLQVFASYSGGTLSRPIARILAQLATPGTQFACPEEPAEVRIFKAGAPYGILLQRDTTNPSAPAAGRWGYVGGVVRLGTALQTGEIAVAISSGEKLFELQTTQNNKQMFIANTDDSKDRTKVQVLYLANTETNKSYVEVALTFQDLLGSEGASTSWFALSTDGTNYSSTISFTNINPGEVRTFYARAIVPANQETMNYRDIYLQISSIELSTL